MNGDMVGSSGGLNLQVRSTHWTGGTKKRYKFLLG